MNIPSYNDIKTRNTIKFANIGGYMLSHTYIEYLNREYGWDKVLKLIKQNIIITYLESQMKKYTMNG